MRGGGSRIFRPVSIPLESVPAAPNLQNPSTIEPLEKLVSQRLPLDRVNEAFDALHQGELARTVIQL